jgi:hypothetical protein
VGIAWLRRCCPLCHAVVLESRCAHAHLHPALATLYKIAPAAGRAEGRVYKRLRVLLRYTACTGLINQQYSHIAAFSLAAVLGAEIVLPPAAKRDSFAHYFSVFKVCTWYRQNALCCLC